MTEKYCVTCRWHRAEYGEYGVYNIYNNFCENPGVASTSLVTGLIVGKRCEDERELEPFACGVDGKLWEAKDAAAD